MFCSFCLKVCKFYFYSNPTQLQRSQCFVDFECFRDVFSSCRLYIVSHYILIRELQEFKERSILFSFNPSDIFFIILLSILFSPKYYSHVHKYIEVTDLFLSNASNNFTTSSKPNIVFPKLSIEDYVGRD